MKLREFRLDLEALFSQTVYGHGYLHYGYWQNGYPEVASLESLGKAQADYFDKLLENIPENVKTILDVGSGTGSNAAGLLKAGYAVDCVCPSANLNKIAEKKLADSSTIHECKFEDFAGSKTYDALVFAESFHYIHADVALQKSLQCCDQYILIFDYFRLLDNDNTQRISHKQFCHMIDNDFKDHFEIVHDEDVTQNIIPTFFVLDTISNEHLKPFIRTAMARFKKEHPIYNFFFGRFLKKIHYFGHKKSISHERFLAKYEYRIMLLKKKIKP
jgi:SAM-dependent methyltransferase